jgi:hypothetical protein
MNDFAKMAVASGIGALVGSLIVPLFNLFASERQVDLKKLELSVGILREAPRKDSDPLRAWALRVLEKQSEPFTQAQRDALLKVSPSK